MSTTTKERGIVLHPFEIRALLNTDSDGEPIDPAKPYLTQIRRPLKIQPEEYEPDTGLFYFSERPMQDLPSLEAQCPYGFRGDRLWVKEKWSAHYDYNVFHPRGITPGTPVTYAASRTRHSGYGRWRASTHMPRWASRITLEIDDVGVQQVQDMSDEDALVSGIQPPPYPHREHLLYRGHGTWVATSAEERIPRGLNMSPAPRTEYAALWDTVISKKLPWGTNPWAYTLIVRRITE